ncbi:hypothetical protein HII31_08218 [Pseudocercospora fuligena]|uniref:Glycoside hydrolase family 35 protein n=1 Tax=Pseudocercospora fuligena TaxID=685502 RepID=A0A8H6RGH1_9PEZI|nr:hypothetical protein HII31_08218 [Pseudocercospora fuligena]
MARPVPHLRRVGNTQQLIVDGEPYLILGGEIQNSQFSAARYVREVWPRLKAANLNTVFASVTWEQIEPIEWQFSFTELDEMIQDARQNDLRIVLLWFGSFKNAQSTYAPAWVKRNLARFPRAEVCAPGGEVRPVDALSVFGHHAQLSDSKAFLALMRHLKEVDGQHRTVLMVQVENEVGLLGDSRDRSRLAEQAWRQAVPAEFLQGLKRHWSELNTTFQQNWTHLRMISPLEMMTWEDLATGDQSLLDELFMAYYFTRYLEKVAAAGKAEYDLPMYINVWQNYAGQDRDTNIPNVSSGGGRPGDYPSGGGVANVLDVWKIFAPSLDIITPDIYLNDYASSCATYRHRGQALLISEQRRDEYGARRLWQAYGSYKCIGTSPFGIDTFMTAEENPFKRHYGLLQRMQKYILRTQEIEAQTGFGFCFDELAEADKQRQSSNDAWHHTFSAWHLTVERASWLPNSTGFGMVIQLDENRFLLVGWGYQVSFTSRRSDVKFTGITRFDEMAVITPFASGEMRTLRSMMNSQMREGLCVAVMPGSTAISGGGAMAPHGSGIAICEPYTVLEGNT